MKSPELTGEWEHQLKQIERGQLSLDRFIEDITRFTHEILQNSASPHVKRSEHGACPECGKAIIQGRKGYGCSGWKGGCGYVFWMDDKGHQLTTEDAQELLQTKRLANPITITPDNGNSQVLLYLSAQGSVLEIPFPIGVSNTKLKSVKASTSRSPSTTDDIETCPSCGGSVVTTKKSFGCANWRKGCTFVIWRKISGKTISKTTASSLLKKRSTSILKGFKSKAGKEFQASLVIKNNKVEFDFS